MLYRPSSTSSKSSVWNKGHGRTFQVTYPTLSWNVYSIRENAKNSFSWERKETYNPCNPCLRFSLCSSPVKIWVFQKLVQLLLQHSNIAIFICFSTENAQSLFGFNLEMNKFNQTLDFQGSGSRSRFENIPFSNRYLRIVASVLYIPICVGQRHLFLKSFYFSGNKAHAYSLEKLFVLITFCTEAL